MRLLGMAGGMQDPNLAAYYSAMQKYQADAQKQENQAGLFSSLAGLAMIPFLGPEAPILFAGGGGGGLNPGSTALTTDPSIASFYNSLRR
jgi:hypothetical protein